MTTDELYLLVAETRCDHGHLTLEDAERAATGDDWTAYLRDAAHPSPYTVRDFHAYQTHAPHLPAAWIVLRTRAERHGHDYGAASGALTLPDLAPLLAHALDPDGSAWRLHAIHRTLTAGDTPTYLVEVVDPTTGEVRTAPSLAAYHHLHAATRAVPSGADTRP